jgi:hypothetical protein
LGKGGSGLTVEQRAHSVKTNLMHCNELTGAIQLARQLAEWNLVWLLQPYF